MRRKNKRLTALIVAVMILFTNTAYAIEKVNEFKPDLWHEDIVKPTMIAFVEPTPTPTPTPKYEEVVNCVHKYLGVPYVWGGTTPKGFDCSGLMQYVYNEVGIKISRTTYTQVKEGIEVSKDNLRPGDLVFFAKCGNVHHVGMYIGNGNMIHAPQTGDVVKIVSLSSRKDYLTARRIINE